MDPELQTLNPKAIIQRRWLLPRNRFHCFGRI